MRTITTKSGAEFSLDGDLLSLLETLYKELNTRYALDRTFEDTIREINEIIKADIRPAIFITSNAKRELSDPFLRRCYCHHIAFPTPEEMHQIIQLHYPNTSAKLLEAAVKIFYSLREHGYEKPPATSELLNWIGALERRGITPTQKELPLIGVLLKRAGDIQSFRGGKGTPKRYR